MKRKLLSILTLLFLSAGFIQAQNTVGLLSYDPTQAFEGYNLMFPHNQSTVWLLNNCGEVVHSWEDTEGYRPGNGVYLRPNGDLVVCKGQGAASNPYIHAGGGGEKVQRLDWDNNLIWEYVANDSLQRLHHDIAVAVDPFTGNETVFMLVWERKTMEEAIQAGRDPANLIEDELWPEKVVEVDYDEVTGELNVVWEWHVWDHMIQDFDPTKDNFGVVADHPELIDINAVTSAGGEADWQHANSIDYNQEFQQIILSVPTFSEIWIIDQSTTTAQAASHNGGLSGRGGDLMFRWGNPAAYGRGDSSDQKLFFQHDVHWADVALSPGHPDRNKLMVFNNRVGVDFSAAAMIDVFFDCYEWYYPLEADGTFAPADFEWVYTAPDPTTMYSTGLSSVQRLPNGNTLIDVGRAGRAFELNPAEEVVWEYKNPLVGGTAVSQGDTVDFGTNLLFRMVRYPADYPAFDNADLTSKGFIEMNPNLGFCDEITAVENIEMIENIEMYPNPSRDWVRLDLPMLPFVYGTLEVYSLIGQSVWRKDNAVCNEYINVAGWQPGYYIVRLNGQVVGKLAVAH